MHERLVFRSFGSPAEVVEREELQKEGLRDGQVRVEMLASPINPADLNYIEGRYGIRPELPGYPGMEGCGQVIETKAEKFQVGERVIFLKRGGVWSEQSVCEVDDLIPVPRDIDLQQAAMLGVNPMTAHLMMKEFVSLEKGDVIIQNASNSGVGRCVIQLAKQRGITVINMVRRAELIEELQAIGGENVIVDDGSARSTVEALGLAAPKLALNCVGGKSALLQLKLLAEEGTQVTYGAMAREPYQIPNGLLIFKRVTLAGFWVTKWLEKAAPAEIADAYSYLARLAVEGRLIQPIEQTFDFSEISAALAAAAQSRRGGKILLVPDSGRLSS